MIKPWKSIPITRDIVDVLYPIPLTVVGQMSAWLLQKVFVFVQMLSASCLISIHSCTAKLVVNKV